MPTPTLFKSVFTSASASTMRRWRFLIVIISATGLSLLPASRAVDPPPDGGYPNNNTAEGEAALLNLESSGFANTGIGYSALHSVGNGDNNTAVGDRALYNNSSNNNTAVGSQALYYNTGSDNTSVGSLAGTSIKGSQNTAVGSSALFGGTINAAASYNTTIGFRSLYSVTTGYGNVANGWQALYSNKSGIYNTATGAETLYNNDPNANNVADFNTATGGRALYTNSSGTSNTASGYLALYSNTSGSYNTAEGISALSNNTTGSNNVAVGRDAGANLTTGSNNIVIGAGLLGASGDTNVTRIGKTTQKKTFIGGIYGKTVASGVGVIVNSSGQLGTVQSSARYKDDIKPMDKASEAILALKPVTFHYKWELDPARIPQFGLIAEEVEKINPDLVLRDEDGKIMTVRYEAVNTMLLNEFLKEYRKVEEQQATIKEMKAAMARQQQEIKTLATSLKEQQASIQQVSERLQAGKPASLVLAND